MSTRSTPAAASLSPATFSSTSVPSPNLSLAGPSSSTTSISSVHPRRASRLASTTSVMTTASTATLSASTGSVPLPHGLQHGSMRRVSAISSRRSNSGVSTPGKKASRGPAHDKDWASMEPDEVFRRLPAGEVKKVEAKMRTDALNKQSELRSMVGTRYRDLLTSATQITSLHSSSLRLSSSLKTVAQACSNPADIAPTADGSSDKADDEDAIRLLPAAAHMKLLIDAPEALYSYLAHHAFLDAAFLWLLTRVAKEGLTSMPEDINAPYLPLLQKQWETLLPFRNQIVQRATAALKSKDKLDSKTVSETLLALILLDNLPMGDALDLFLSQRLKAVRDLLAHSAISISSKPQLEIQTSQTRRRRDSRVQAATFLREAAHGRDAIGKVLREAVQALLDTANLAASVFGPRKKLQDDDSLLAEMIKLVQEGEAVQAPAPIPVRRPSGPHMRRTSRLTSISLPLPRLNSQGGRGPPVSSSRILQQLPSPQILLTNLPSSIMGFTPFITPSSPPAVADKIAQWQRAAIDVVREATPSWLRDLQSVADVWHIRGDMKHLLGEGQFESQTQEALEREWGARVSQLWETKLESLVVNAENVVRDAAEQVRNAGNPDEADPDSFTFSDVTFPSGPNPALAGHYTAFSSFISTIKKRSARRTPVLDSVLLVLEDAATDIKADMQGLPQALYDEYSSKAAAALDGLVKTLSRLLTSMGPSRGDNKEGIEAELFVGRVAIYLAKSSSFLNDITGETSLDVSPTASALVAVHSASTAQWQKRAVKEAIIKLEPLFDDLRGSREAQLSWPGPQPTQPSSAVMTALSSLVKAVRIVGLPPNVELPVGYELVSAFVKEANALPGWKTQGGALAAQSAVDVGFMVALKGDDVVKDELVQQLLTKVPEDMKSTFLGELPSIVLESQRRSQILLHNLTGHLVSKTRPVMANNRGVVSADGRNAALLRLGVPAMASKAATVGADFISPIAVAKPGKRFGLLSVVG